MGALIEACSVNVATGGILVTEGQRRFGSLRAAMQGPASPPPDAARGRRRYAPRMAPEQRREQLLDAALSVILEQGYSGVSIEAIARAAGVTRPVIYDHF